MYTGLIHVHESNTQATCICHPTAPAPHPQTADPRFPVGKARLETIGVLGCACIMSVATVEVVQDAVRALYDGLANGGSDWRPGAV